MNEILQGDSLAVLKTLPSESVDCVITSPPYWGLRDYGNDGQIGLEKTPEAYVAKLVEVFKEVKRVLKKEGTLWLNLGDSYASNGKEGGDIDQDTGMDIERGRGRLNKHSVIKPKDLVGIPWRVAFALQADGWYLRQDIIWAKPNPMPESVTDRCTKSHEYIFLLTKSPKYFFDNEAVQEVAVTDENRPHGVVRDREYEYDSKQKVIRSMWKEKAVSEGSVHVDGNEDKMTGRKGFETRPSKTYTTPAFRNRRSVWTVNTMPYKEAHFATFPEKLIEPMILAGCPKEVCNKCGVTKQLIVEKEFVGDSNKRKSPTGKDYGQPRVNTNTGNGMIIAKEIGRYFTDCGCNAGFSGGTVLDIFMGAGTTAVVAKKLGRNYLGIELNPAYIEIAEKRIKGVTPPLF